jgi:hypothetical protein
MVDNYNFYLFINMNFISYRLILLSPNLISGTSLLTAIHYFIVIVVFVVVRVVLRINHSHHLFILYFLFIVIVILIDFDTYF